MYKTFSQGYQICSLPIRKKLAEHKTTCKGGGRIIENVTANDSLGDIVEINIIWGQEDATNKLSQLIQLID
jgi:hypothetical protein